MSKKKTTGSKAKSPAFEPKIGAWYRLLKAFKGIKKGSLVVLCSKGCEYVGWPAEFAEVVNICSVDVHGESNTERVKVDEVKQVLKLAKAPMFVVTWTKECGDPHFYCETLAEARAFKASILRRRGNQKVVEASIYKLA